MFKLRPRLEYEGEYTENNVHNILFQVYVSLSNRKQKVKLS